ncbi:MAG: EAL domain-containing protein [Acidothermus sp.]|nr:EAL domain-containing protein [Acidothermus sp.]
MAVEVGGSSPALERFADARVLVVDDNGANLQLLVTLLTRAGLRHIVTASDGESALQLIREMSPDLVLLDLRMPKLDGYAVLSELRSSEEAQYLPVLVLTADLTKEAVHRALDLGARDFLTKPFDATEVVLRVRNLLEMRALHCTLREHNIALAEELEKRRAQDEELTRLLRERIERIEAVLASPDALSTVFQPIVRLRDLEPVGLEALSRFSAAPQRPPDVWFGEASSVGLGPELESKALQRAIAFIDALPSQAFLAVNVSPEFVLSRKLDVLADFPACDRLVLELTEHAAVEDYALIQERLAPFRERGARVAIDDTGAGFASLRHLLLLQPEVIKLDLSITRGVDHDPARRALASALVGFAKDVGAHLIAEGVETARELETLAALGIEWAQGFHLGKPQPLPIG